MAKGFGGSLYFRKRIPAENTMNGFSTLQKLTNDYLLLQTTERSTVEMKLLPLVNNTYVVCMISTVNGPVPDSRIEFFTTNWEPLATSDLFTQPTSDWYIKQGIDKKDEAYQEAASHLDMDLIQYRLSPDDQTLTAIYTTPQYLSQEAREKIEPYLIEPKSIRGRNIIFSNSFLIHPLRYSSRGFFAVLLHGGCGNTARGLQ
mgnify:FL=1